MVSFSRWLALNTKLLNFDCQSPSLGCAVLYYSWARKINISFRKKPSCEQCEWEWKRADRFLSPPHSPDAGRVKSFHFLVAEKGIKCWNHTVSDQCVVRRVGLVASDPCKAVACLPTAHFGRWYSVAVLFEVFHRVDTYVCVFETVGLSVKTVSYKPIRPTVMLQSTTSSLPVGGNETQKFVWMFMLTCCYR